jgi:Putative DNA-binding domain
MLSLRDTQAAFCAAILADESPPMLPLVHAGGISAQQRLQIYRNNNRLGSLATLQATYPVIERLGGPEWFRQSTAQYQRHCPSRSGDLQYLGERYPDFLRAELAHTEYGYFSDVAALEWAYQMALTAAERAPVDLGRLREFAPCDYDRLLFVPRPAVRLVESPYPILKIWQANQSSTADVHPQIRLDDGASRVLLIRRSDHVELRDLPCGSYRLLRQFQLGATLGSAAAAVAAEIPEFALDVCLRELVGLEVMTDIELQGDEHAS